LLETHAHTTTSSPRSKDPPNKKKPPSTHPKPQASDRTKRKAGRSPRSQETKLLFPASNRLLLRVPILLLGGGGCAFLDLDLLPHSKKLLGGFDLGGGGVVVEDDGSVIHRVGTALLGGGGCGRFFGWKAVVLLSRSDGGLLLRCGVGVLSSALLNSRFGLVGGRGGGGFDGVAEDAELVF